jgi:23S rRNA pseudouridine2605 synthase/16S rRNA pseudouridine516 synthase
VGARAPPRWLQAARQRQQDEDDWLSRALSRAGVFPFGEAEAAVKSGRVTVDGRAATQPLAPVKPTARVLVDGREVDLRPTTRVLLFHKPAGVVTAGSDPEGEGTVFEVLSRALPPALQGYGWHAVGRLDRDTTGLLLFTNDERFVAHATHPDTHLPKRYLAKVGAAVTEAKLAQLRAGVPLEPGVTSRPAQAELVAEDVVALTLTEGRYHQVKRMLNAVGLPTLALHREAVGGLRLDVPVGQLREVPPEAIREALRYAPRG